MNRVSANLTGRSRLVVGVCVLLVSVLASSGAATADENEPLTPPPDIEEFCQGGAEIENLNHCINGAKDWAEREVEPVVDTIERELEPTLDWVEDCIEHPEDPVIDCVKEELSPVLPDWLEQCLESTVTECADDNVPSLVTATGDSVDWVVNESPEWSTTTAQWGLDPDSHIQPQATSDCSWHDPRGAGWYPPNGNCKYAQANNVVTCSTNCRSAELSVIQWRGGTASGECFPENDVSLWGLYSAQVIRASDNAVLWEHPEFHGWFENCDVYDGTDNHVIKMTLHSDTIVRYVWYHGWFSEVELFISVRGPGGGGGGGGGSPIGGACGIGDGSLWNTNRAGGLMMKVQCL